MIKILISFVFLFPLLAQATNVFVAPVQGTNLSQEESRGYRELIKLAVQKESDYNLVDSIDEASLYLQAKVIHVNTYTLFISKGQGNQTIAQKQWKAENSNELEALIDSSVTEILNTETNEEQAVLYENKKSLGEQAEEKKARSNFERVPARRQVSLGFGPAYFSNMQSPGTGIGINAGYLWNIDDHFDLGLQSDFAISTQHADAYFFSGKILTNYFFSTTDISPFLGAGFGYGFASAHDRPTIADSNSSGFAVGLHAGVKFFRTSTVNLAVSGEYNRIFDDNTLGQPSVFMLKVALHY